MMDLDFRFFCCQLRFFGMRMSQDLLRSETGSERPTPGDLVEMYAVLWLTGLLKAYST